MIAVVSISCLVMVDHRCQFLMFILLEGDLGKTPQEEREESLGFRLKVTGVGIDVPY